MASFASLSMSRVVGSGVKQMTGSAEWVVPGIDGEGIHLFGKRPIPVRIKLVNYGSESALKSWENSLADKVGSIIGFTNDQGTVHTDYFFKTMSQMTVRTADPFGLRGEIDATVRAQA